LEKGSYGEGGMSTSPIYPTKVQSQPKYTVCSTPSPQNPAATMALYPTKQTPCEAKDTVGGTADLLGTTRVAWEATKGTEELKKILRVDQGAAGGAADFFVSSQNGKMEQRQEHLEQGTATVAHDPTGQTLPVAKGTVVGAAGMLTTPRVSNETEKREVGNVCRDNTINNLKDPPERSQSNPSNRKHYLHGDQVAA